MKLYFVRHTSASDSAATDASRPLTRQGEEEARLVGVGLAGLGVRTGRIFSSPLLRAQQTAGIIARELKFAGQPGVLQELINGESTDSLLDALPAVGEAMLIGHMPSLAEHVAQIMGGRDASRFAFGKGSVACVDVAAGRLEWLKHLSEFSPRR